MDAEKLTGHCYCGAVSFEVTGQPDWVGHCHCESCRRASGAVMSSFAGFRPGQVVFGGAMPERFTTPDGVTRSFCGRCGSAVAFEYDRTPNEIHLQLGLFDDLEKLPAQSHSFVAEKPSWLHADEHLPAQDWDPDS